MNESKLELYWSELPVGKENAWDYDRLCCEWNTDKRTARHILHELSRFDNGDDMILIRSSHVKGFYKTDDADEIAAYRRECLNRGRNTFAPLRKIDRVLKQTDGQLTFKNNLRAVRQSVCMKQSDVCQQMKDVDPAFDTIMLSKMENDRCLPSGIQLAHLAFIYGCTPLELVNVSLYAE